MGVNLGLHNQPPVSLASRTRLVDPKPQAPIYLSPVPWETPNQRHVDHGTDAL